jgi:hypothetical protein
MSLQTLSALLAAEKALKRVDAFCAVVLVAAALPVETT